MEQPNTPTSHTGRAYPANVTNVQQDPNQPPGGSFGAPPPQGYPEPAKQTHKRRNVVVLSAVGLIALIGIPIAIASGSGPQTMRGTISVKGAIPRIEVHEGDVGCKSAAGYDDVKLGASVTVRDSKGEVVGIGYVGEGVWRFPAGESIRYALCEFPISADVSGQSNLYSVEVSHRGEVQVSRDALQHIALSLGS